MVEGEGGDEIRWKAGVRVEGSDEDVWNLAIEVSAAQCRVKVKEAIELIMRGLGLGRETTAGHSPGQDFLRPPIVL